MDCVPWNDRYSVGVRQIDEQHQKLVGIMNKLCDFMDKGEENYVIGEVLEELAEYAWSHFALEERYFIEFDYDKTDEHVAQHREFSKQVSSLKKDLSEGKETVSTDTISFLGKWFTEHVLTYDKEYIPCFHKHRLA